MPTDYGTDVLGLDDIDDPETVVSGELNLAYALARRLITPTGAMLEIGDTAPYDSIDIRLWMGARFSLLDRTMLDDLQMQARQVLTQDERVASITVLATFASGTLSVAVQGFGAEGPFSFIVATNGVTAQFLRGP